MSLSEVLSVAQFDISSISSNLQVTSASTQLYIGNIEIAPVKVGMHRQQSGLYLTSTMLYVLLLPLLYSHAHWSSNITVHLCGFLITPGKSEFQF